jgi:hypothetical protein
LTQLLLFLLLQLVYHLHPLSLDKDCPAELAQSLSLKNPWNYILCSVANVNILNINATEFLEEKNKASFL